MVGVEEIQQRIRNHRDEAVVLKQARDYQRRHDARHGEARWFKPFGAEGIDQQRPDRGFQGRRAPELAGQLREFDLLATRPWAACPRHDMPEVAIELRRVEIVPKRQGRYWNHRKLDPSLGQIAVDERRAIGLQGAQRNTWMFLPESLHRGGHKSRQEWLSAADPQLAGDWVGKEAYFFD